MSVTVERKLHDQPQDQRFRLDPSGDGDPRSASSASPRNATRKKIVLAVLAVAGGGLLIAAIAALAGDFGKAGQPLIYHTVTRGDLPITVTERGNLESQDNVKVLCEVDDVEGDSIHGTPILSIVPNGSSVKKGDLLVQLDSSKHQERLDRQILGREKANAEHIKTKAQHANQITQNETTLAEAKLKVQLAELDLRMYQDVENGTHQLAVEEIKRLVEDIENKILETRANLELRKNDLHGIESLFKLGYKGKSELDRSRLEFLQAESAYASQLNKLKTQLATLAKKETYEKEMQMLVLEGAVKTADRTKTQVERDNDALLEQAKAAMDAADEALKKEEERLARYQEQLKNCMIYAPTDGMVAYASGSSRWRQEVRQGSPVTPRQHIISLPNLKKMQVKTAVHESVLNEVKVGLPATVRVDAFPERAYRGSVLSVGVLPQEVFGSDTKVYTTMVTVDEEVEQLKPGMTAVVEIHVDRLKDVLTVPVQAVVNIGKDSWCYVDLGGSVERKMIQLGRTNGKFVEIREGLQEGDRVVLNPSAIMDERSEEDSSISPEKDSTQPSDGQRPEPAASDSPSDAVKQPGADRTGKGRPAGKGRPGADKQPGRGPGRRESGSNRPPSAAGASAKRPGP